MSVIGKALNEIAPYRSRPDLLSYQGEPAGSSEEPHGPVLFDYWRIIKKSRWAILGVFLIVVLTAIVVTFLITPTYTAETTLLIDPQGPQVVEIKQVLSESRHFDEREYYTTQYEILKSRSLAAQVIREEKLTNHPFYKDIGQGWFFFKEQAGSIYPVLTEWYLDRMLEVKPLKDSRLVTVAISTPDPQLSARLANAHARAYIAQGMNLRTRANTEALQFLETKLRELKQRLQTSETALNQFRRKTGIVSLDHRENIIVDRLSDLNKRLTEAEVERISLEAQAILIRGKNYDSIPAVVNSQLIEKLKIVLARLEAEYAKLGENLMPAHPQMVQMKAEMDDVRKRLQKEIRNVVGGVQSAYASAQAKEKTLREAMERQKSATFSLKDAAVDYAVLSREADTNRQLYDSVLHRLKEIGVATELRSSNISIIDNASPPAKPSKPNLWLNLLVSAVVGTTVGLGLVFLREHFDTTLRSAEDVESYLRVPNLAVVPEFSKLNRKALASEPPDGKSLLPGNVGKRLVLFQHPHSAISEAYSTLHTSILLSRAGEPPKSILFTSGRAGEGKTITALNTGIVFSRMGSRVLIIDADLRAAACHKLLGVENRQGLTEIITGMKELSEVVQPTSIDAMFFLASGSIPPTPAALLGSKKMQELLAEVRQHYDFILIDSPPLMPVTDAVLLSTLVDGVILVIDSQSTPNHVAKEMRRRLTYARANIVGVVLNRYDPNNDRFTEYYASYYPEQA